MPDAGGPLDETRSRFPNGDQEIDAMYVRPQGAGVVPGVVLLHDVYGLTDHIKDVARRLASQGYGVLAVDLYSRGGQPGWPPKREEIARMINFPDQRTLTDVQAAVIALQARPDVASDRVGLVGFSLGARYSLLACGDGAQVAAALMFYPVVVYPELTEARPRQPLQSVPRIQCPCAVFYGDRDATVPLAHATFFRSLLEGHGKRHEFHLYPGANHGFFNPTIKTYDHEAAEDAWAKSLAFLKRHLRTGGKRLRDER